MIPGVDTWSGYGLIDWHQVYRAGYRFAIVKMAEGNEPRRDDMLFRASVEGAKAAGLFVGGYFFPYPLPSGPGLPSGRAPEEQAERAFTVSQGLGMRPGELPHCVDAEWPEVGDWGRWGCDARQIGDWLKRYCQRATALWGRPPIIYTYPFWWRVLSTNADVSWAADYDLWIANYSHPGEGVPPATLQPIVPSPWRRWRFWQHSAKGSPVRVPGIHACPVDRNVFAGSFDDLRRLALHDPDADTQPEIRLDLLDSDRPTATGVVTDLREAQEALRQRRLDEIRDDDPDDAA